MKNSDIDEKIRKIAQKQQIRSTDAYERQIDRAIQEGRKRDAVWNKKMHYPKAAAAILAIGILLISGVGVNAAMNYVQKRMDQVTDTEKQAYRMELNDSDASGDLYSRAFTPAEKKRIRKLEKAYKENGIYPEGKILHIDDKSQMIPDRICFQADTSCFYLPEGKLTDEDMLELIDFYYIRDHSLELPETEDQSEFHEIEITQERAVEIAETAVQQIFGSSKSDLEIFSDYQQGDDGEKKFSTDYIELKNQKSGVDYTVTVDLQKGTLESVSICNQDQIYTDHLKIDEQKYKEKFDEISTLADQFFEKDMIWTSRKIVYSVTDEETVRNGVVQYCFMSEDGVGCVISYSQSMDQVYQIRWFSEEQLNEKEKAEQAKRETRSIEMD